MSPFSNSKDKLVMLRHFAPASAVARSFPTLFWPVHELQEASRLVSAAFPDSLYTAMVETEELAALFHC